jgi:hypothetical protein
MDTRAPPAKRWNQFLKKFKAGIAWRQYIKYGSLCDELYLAGTEAG